MPTFMVEAVDAQGNPRKFQIEAASSQEAVGKAKQKGFTPRNVKEAGGGSGTTNRQAPTGAGPGGAPPGGAPPGAAGPGGKPAPEAAGPIRKKGKGFVLFGRVSQKELTTFTSQLAILMDAGLPIVRSLKILAGQMKPGMFKNVLSEIADDVETGSSFSESLAKHPKVFDKQIGRAHV